MEAPHAWPAAGVSLAGPRWLEQGGSAAAREQARDSSNSAARQRLALRRSWVCSLPRLQQMPPWPRSRGPIGSSSQSRALASSQTTGRMFFQGAEVAAIRGALDCLHPRQARVPGPHRCHAANVLVGAPRGHHRRARDLGLPRRSA